MKEIATGRPAKEAKINFTCEASPLKTQARIKRAVATHLNEGRSQHYTPKWTEPVDVTEGCERCGYGALHISGTVEYWNGYATQTYTINNHGSQWRNYGAPHGTRHDVSIEVLLVASVAPCSTEGGAR